MTIKHSSNRLPIRLAGIAGAVATGAAALGLATTATADAATFPKATVHAEGGLIGHIRPSTHGPRNYTFPNGSTVHVDCRVQATSVGGNRTWYLISGEGEANWVSGKYLTVHGHSQQCSSRSIRATATKDSGLFQGPTTRDEVPPGAEMLKGDKLTVRCYTGGFTTPRWVLTEKSDWVRASALRTNTKIPYCSQTS